jgi:hypothetical protein
MPNMGARLLLLRSPLPWDAGSGVLGLGGVKSHEVLSESVLSERLERDSRWWEVATGATAVTATTATTAGTNDDEPKTGGGGGIDFQVFTNAWNQDLEYANRTIGSLHLELVRFPKSKRLNADQKGVLNKSLCGLASQLRTVNALLPPELHVGPDAMTVAPASAAPAAAAHSATAAWAMDADDVDVADGQQMSDEWNRNLLTSISTIQFLHLPLVRWRKNEMMLDDQKGVFIKNLCRLASELRTMNDVLPQELKVGPDYI